MSDNKTAFTIDGDNLVITFDDEARQILKENHESQGKEWDRWNRELIFWKQALAIHPNSTRYVQYLKSWEQQQPRRQNDVEMFTEHIESFLCNGWSLVDVFRAGFLVDDTSLIFTQDEVTDSQGEYLWLGMCYRWNLESIYSWVEYMIEHGSITLWGAQVNLLHIPGYHLLTDEDRALFDQPGGQMTLEFANNIVLYIRYDETLKTLTEKAKRVFERLREIRKPQKGWGIYGVQIVRHKGQSTLENDGVITHRYPVYGFEMAAEWEAWLEEVGDL